MTSKENTKKHYIDKKLLNEELKKYRDTNIISEQLALYIQQIVENYSSKGSFKTYSYLDDMKSCAVCRILDQLDKLDPEKNAFAYMTTMIYNVFIAFIGAEKKYCDMKDEYRVKVWTDLSMEENLDMKEIEKIRDELGDDE
jgi:hypothetical protein